MNSIKIIKKNANDVRKELIKNNQLNYKLKLYSDEDYVYMPLKDNYDTNFINSLMQSYPIEITDNNINFESSEKQKRNFMDYLKDEIDNSQVNAICKSFDIIGDIVIVEIPDEVKDLKYKIGDAVLKFTKRKSVYAKASNIKGVTRTRDLEYLAGVNNLETIYKENGVRFKLNPSTVYFSPRLGTERARIVSTINEGDVVIDFFAGIGSFPVSIARYVNAKIYSVDINPEAYKYMCENIKLNKLKGEVVPICSDINDIVDDLPMADHILMNLPGKSCEFLPLAISHLKYGGILNYYEFATDYETVIEHVRKAAADRLIEVINIRKVKSQSPGVWHIAADIKIK